MINLLRFLSIITLLPPLLVVWIAAYSFTPGPAPVSNEEAVVVIPANSSLGSIEKILKQDAIIKPDCRFRLLARLMAVAASLKAGEYIFSRPLSPFAVLSSLNRGDTISRDITIPEGTSLDGLAAILAGGGWGKPGDFLKLAGDRNFINTLGIGADSLEGYLFPDTYSFRRGLTTPGSIIRTMATRMQSILTATGADQGLPEYDLDVHGIITLASIIEKETARPAERPLIARVFLNRLKAGMKLQTDPTVIYGIKDFNGNLTRRDLKRPTPYNTYLIKGLPPGPICNPGRDAIEAVLHPAEGSFYYFVSKNDGSHYFSRSLKEHNRAVRRYQQKH